MEFAQVTRAAVRVIGVGLVGVLGVAGLTACSPQEPEGPPLSSLTNPATTAPEETAPTEEDIAFEDAEVALRRHIELLGALGHHPTNKRLLARLKSTSNGQEYNLRNTLYRYAWGPKGIHLQGDGVAVVDHVDRLDADLQADRPTVTLSVCIDSSDVVAVNKEGKQISHEGAKSSLTATVMHDPDGRWRVNKSDTSATAPC